MCKLQLAEVSSAATYVGMVICEWHCVITVTLYVYFVDQCHLHILFSDFYEIIFTYLCHFLANIIYSNYFYCNNPFLLRETIDKIW